jgi:CGNR zinc finger
MSRDRLEPHGCGHRERDHERPPARGRAGVRSAPPDAGCPRRPLGARRAMSEDPFEHLGPATRLLGSFLGRPIEDAELRPVRRLAGEAAAIAERVAGGLAPSLGELNRLAAGCAGRLELAYTPAGAFEAAVVWEPAPAAAELARRIVEELGAIQPSRLRRCARPECGLIFYDSSRSGTQRWHSEIPCGWRERQRRRRGRGSPTA